MARVVIAATFVIAALALGAHALGVRPHVVTHWALYLGTPRSAKLYLDPFPDRASCRLRVAAFAANGERAFCGKRYDVESGYAEDAVLAADFSIFNPGRWLCAPRRTTLSQAR